MRKKCSRCGVQFEAEEDFYVLCTQGENNCASEVDLYGSGKLWRAVSTLINGRWTREEMKDLSDSAAIWDFLDDLMDEKDMDTKRNWLSKHVNRVLS